MANLGLKLKLRNFWELSLTFDVRSPGKPLMKLLHPGPHGPPDLHQVGRLYRNTPTRNHDFSGVKWNRNGRELVALGHDGSGFKVK